MRIDEFPHIEPFDPRYPTKRSLVVARVIYCLTVIPAAAAFVALLVYTAVTK